MTRQALEARILRLDINGAIAFLAEVLLASPNSDAERDYAEPAAPCKNTACAREHTEIFAPMQRLFGLIREIGTAIPREFGAFG